MEVGLVAAVTFHAFNGLRVMAIDFWEKGTRYQKQMTYAVLTLFILAMAASVITILSEVVLQIGFYVLLRRALGAIPWVAMLARPVLAAAVMFGVLALLWPIAPPFGLIAAGLTYPAVLMVLRPLDQIEIERLTPLLPAPLRRFART